MDRSTFNCTGSFYTACGEEYKGDAVLIPILQNIMDIQEDEELLVYRDPHVTPVSIEPPEKRSASPTRLNPRPKKTMRCT